MDDPDNSHPTEPLSITYQPSARYTLTALGHEVLRQNEAHIPDALAPDRDRLTHDDIAELRRLGLLRDEALALAKARHAASQRGVVIQLFDNQGA
jgi:hypothetical protein